MRLDLVVAGVGGQGVLTFASVLTKAAVREGYDAHYLMLAGLAQLGSPVRAHVRLGLPAGTSPKISKARAQLVVGLERLEALRVAPFLAPAGRALLATDAVLPYEARFRKGRYPTQLEVEEAFAGREVLWVPTHDLAGQHGTSALASAVMLGALAAITPVVERENLIVALREELPHLADVEVEAFFEGYGFVTGNYE
ncbi:MAG: 2-oxoacid:acceptor oxidoreductase family protein [Deltaproteobacteria bacterium]|nr:2-oxoacid:acceptor oxidoreductase family protein [Deltaproteobacteria bacterium]